MPVLSFSIGVPPTCSSSVANRRSTSPVAECFEADSIVLNLSEWKGIGVLENGGFVWLRRSEVLATKQSSAPVRSQSTQVPF